MWICTFRIWLDSYRLNHFNLLEVVWNHREWFQTELLFSLDSSDGKLERVAHCSGALPSHLSSFPQILGDKSQDPNVSDKSSTSRSGWHLTRGSYTLSKAMTTSGLQSFWLWLIFLDWQRIEPGRFFHQIEKMHQNQFTSTRNDDYY